LTVSASARMPIEKQNAGREHLPGLWTLHK
jgi:hypothetical protein